MSLLAVAGQSARAVNSVVDSLPAQIANLSVTEETAHSVNLTALQNMCARALS